jgi:hypothetical protein
VIASSRHAGEGRHPRFCFVPAAKSWMPAFAGMTEHAAVGMAGHAVTGMARSAATR